MSDLKRAYGGANIRGVVIFELKRDPSNDSKVVLISVNIDAVVDDMYDFDWTRLRTWPSRHGAMVQIGWQLPDRKGGRVFVTETEVNRLYHNESAISKFNNSYWISLLDPTPGPSIPPSSPTE